MIQRRLAWPLFKDDTQIREAFHIFGLRSLKLFQKLEENGDLYLPVQVKEYPYMNLEPQIQGNALEKKKKKTLIPE